eukprot:CAMPEP_0171567244 /NCGR_PEP_ID=MMETSP0961-20121227/1051_1 /TAXON_ID=87120 /ORGANISM="Aurantiochytrium limacinum, Strain ATCCMYA-1381" /LENGTH=418 /DNA_ID=CAMNT_0012121141 /DNA_START=1 /DNA_END=1258 /DNA_ORIENTATION=-
MWFVLDNGGFFVKCGVAEEMVSAAREALGAAPEKLNLKERNEAIRRAATAMVTLVPNCTARMKKDTGSVFVGTEVEKVQDQDSARLSFTRPLERGYLTNVECQQQIWEQVFETCGLEGPSSITGLILTTPSFVPKEIQTATDTLLRAHFGIKNIILAHPAELAARDAGRVFEPGVRRLDVGGKLLTNYLRELVSYGQINLQDETNIVDKMKQDVCFVSLNIEADLKLLANLERQPSLPVESRALEAQYTRRYVLPDFQTTMEGYVLPSNTDNEDILRLKNQTIALKSECFMVPELLFSPNDLGLYQAGLPQIVEDVINLCPRELHVALRRNVLLTGGTTQFPNFAERLSQELGPSYSIRHVADPIRAACFGGRCKAPIVTPQPTNLAASPQSSGPVATPQPHLLDAISQANPPAADAP